MMAVLMNLAEVSLKPIDRSWFDFVSGSSNFESTETTFLSCILMYLITKAIMILINVFWPVLLDNCPAPVLIPKMMPKLIPITINVPKNVKILLLRRLMGETSKCSQMTSVGSGALTK